MRRWLLAVLLLASKLALCADRDVEFLIMLDLGKDSSGRPRSATAVESAVRNFVAIAVTERFPCAKVVTDQDIKDQLGFQRLKDMLSVGNSAELEAVANSLNADYLINLKVDQIGGAYFLNGMQLNPHSAKTLDRTGGRVAGGQNTADLLEAWAESFAATLTGPKCDPNPWTGTIAYSDKNDSHREQTDSSGKVKTVEEQRASMEYTIQIPKYGMPFISTIAYQSSNTSERSYISHRNCGAVGSPLLGNYQEANGPAKETSSMVTTGKGTNKNVPVHFEETSKELRISVSSVQFETKTVNTATKTGPRCPDDAPTQDQHSEFTGSQDTRIPTIPPLALQPGQKRVSGRYPTGDQAQPSLDPADKHAFVTIWELEKVTATTSPKRR